MSCQDADLLFFSWKHNKMAPKKKKVKWQFLKHLICLISTTSCTTQRFENSPVIIPTAISTLPMRAHSSLGPCGNGSPRTHIPNVPGNLRSTDQESLPVAGNNAPAARGEVQPRPRSMLNLPSEASPGGRLAAAVGIGGNRPETITSFYPNCYKAVTLC